MGRTDEVQFLLECAKAWQGRGARVTFQAGWETRGNGLQGNYEGCIVHHTAFVSSAAKPNPALSTLINGRPDLSGPLCNVTGPWCADRDPLLHVIAAYPANHAGASGGRSMGPLPKTSLFNPRVLGLEIDYAGVTPMTAGQYRAATIFARGVSDVLGRSTEYARAHGETSVTGKWDPGYALNKTIDMAAFRRDAASVQGADMPLSDDDLRKLHDAVWFGASGAKLLPNGSTGGAEWAYTTLGWLQERIRRDVVATLATTAPVAAPAAAVSVDAAAVAKALAGDKAFLDGLAKAVNDEQDRRARDGDPKTGPAS